jgi:hypothetical protein
VFLAWIRDFLVPISARIPTTQIKVLHGISQFLQACARTIPWIRPELLLSTSFPYCLHLQLWRWRQFVLPVLVPSFRTTQSHNMADHIRIVGCYQRKGCNDLVDEVSAEDSGGHFIYSVTCLRTSSVLFLVVHSQALMVSLSIFCLCFKYS